MQTLNITDRDGVRRVELNRPDALNALDAQMTDDLADAFLDAVADDQVKVLVLTGAGKAFWAGADLKQMGRDVQHVVKHGFGAMLDAIIDFPKPFIVAVNGVGVGIGATICGLADLVYMSERARLRCPFSALGLTAEAASTVSFARLMGHQQASWFLLAGEWMSADDCVKSGLALEVLPHAELIPRVMQRAATLAALPSSSLRATKSLMTEGLRAQLKSAVRSENAALAELAGGAANREALAAFREKRAPDFTGL